MVYAITLNTAVDTVLIARSSKKHNHNEIDKKVTSLGGKAIKTNVLLTKYNIPNKALGFIGGENGTTYLNMLSEKGIDANFTKSSTYNTRVCTVIVDEGSGGSTMYVEKPTKLLNSDIERFMNILEDIKPRSIVLLAGSLPEGFTIDHFKQVINILKSKNSYIICDVSGKQLEIAIEMEVDFVKPNEEEFKDYFGVESITLLEIEKNLGHLNSYAVSLGEKGCIYKTSGIQGKVSISKKFQAENQIKSTTGCGDMFIAGYIKGLINKENPIISATQYSMAKAISYGSDEIDETKIEKIKMYIGE